MKTCQYCGFKSNAMDRNKHGWFCRSDLRCFNRILIALRHAQFVGRQMANLCFNLSQQSGRLLNDQACGTMRNLYEQWDSRGLKR